MSRMPALASGRIGVLAPWMGAWAVMAGRYGLGRSLSINLGRGAEGHRSDGGASGLECQGRMIERADVGRLEYGCGDARRARIERAIGRQGAQHPIAMAQGGVQRPLQAALCVRGQSRALGVERRIAS